jgi:superfamily II DNA or RNA helicase
LRARAEIQAEIEREEARLAELRQEVDEAAVRLAALRQELSSASGEGQAGPSPEPAHPPKPDVLPAALVRDASKARLSSAEKIDLFRSLFRGRADVFPRRWENPATGRSGYSPACANEWDQRLCRKSYRPPGGRRGTCGECPNQAFLPVSDEEIEGHLRGEQVMGVYPMLPDETCWLLAADFDKTSWHEDVAAFATTCRTRGVPVAIERSRSGNGAHAWFFFSAPVPAVTARKLACFLVTETMASRHQLAMDSYDRLFPNQDTMPRGGFGNLIALPLQQKARQLGNTVFVDSELRPFPDQWAFLATLRRMEPAWVDVLANEAARQGQVIGVRMSDPPDADEETPWNRRPSGGSRQSVISEPLPATARAILCQRVFIEKAGLPSSFLNQLKRLAAFQNPEFYQKQSLRLSTALTPRVIACAEELAEHIALPRGCLPGARALFREHGVDLVVEDKREDGSVLQVDFRGELTPMQEQAARAMLEHDTGVLVAPPGTGKTVIAAYLVAARRRNALILVHRKPLLDQWVAQLSLFLGIEEKEIGRIGAGTRRPTGKIDVAMLQSLGRKGSVSDLVAGYGLVIVDEAHHIPAVSFERVLSDVRARYVVGLTATPQRRDGHHPITQMQLGPIRFREPSGSQALPRPFAHRLIVRETSFSADSLPDGTGIQEIYAALAADQARNDLIFDDVVQRLEEKRSPILLTERRDHLEHFAQRLRGFARNLVVLHGGMRPKERRDVLARLATIPDDEERLLLATGRYIGEGFDDARLDTLFLALPVSWKGTLVQYTGRLHRLRPGKTEVRIYDYVDRAVAMLVRMFEKRLRGYRAIGYAVDVSESEVPRQERRRVVEYDEEDPLRR